MISVAFIYNYVQGLTLDIDRGNLLRLGKDGIILAASHGTRKMSDIEIEKSYGRGRRKHIATNYATHLNVSLIILSSYQLHQPPPCESDHLIYYTTYFSVSQLCNMQSTS